MDVFNFAAFFTFYPAPRTGPHFEFGINHSILSPSRRQVCSLADSIFCNDLRHAVSVLKSTLKSQILLLLLLLQRTAVELLGVKREAER